MHIHQPLRGTLAQLHHVLSQLTDDEYGKPLTILNNASIGQHTRHVIEFLQTLINDYDAGVINYDKRKRNRLLETDKACALQAILLINDYPLRKDRDIVLVGTHAPGSQETAVKTTYYRELVYNLEHAVHHMAMIRIAISQCFNVPMPPDFGVAAATIQYRQSVL